MSISCGYNRGECQWKAKIGMQSTWLLLSDLMEQMMSMTRRADCPQGLWIKCIEEHKLEEQYPVYPAPKARLHQLEKAKGRQEEGK
ncbi:hypothetical protein NC653_007696 [Populus alba x Populus x berolinensis]|uniref:Uncharacterized protein n=1 Tax=Populus alba x Populus x berolinensis TaxID=444605 RepID=A0AAD6RJ06_9ROSI|nr:hypothetical protein NC653_007696 [Populus alba x Populus x berolinensis]